MNKSCATSKQLSQSSQCFFHYFTLKHSQFSQMCWSIEIFHAWYVHFSAVDYTTFQYGHLVVRTPMIEISVMLAIDENLKTFACHSNANFERLTAFEWKYSATFFVFVIKSADKMRQKVIFKSIKTYSLKFDEKTKISKTKTFCKLCLFCLQLLNYNYWCL